MKLSLSLKLVLAFLVVSITGTALAALLIRWSTLNEFKRLVSNRMQDDFIAYVSIYYQIYGSWDGLAQNLNQFHSEEPPAGEEPAPWQPRVPWDWEPQGDSQPDEGMVRPQRPLVFFALVDPSGQVVAPAGQYNFGDRVSEKTINDEGSWIELNGEIIGAVLPISFAPTLSAQESRYLARADQALLYASLGATILALILGAILANTLTRPLRELTTAIRSMSKGDLEQRVIVRSQDELGELATAFNQMSTDLATANALRRQMTADIAHELRTPLTVITGYLESLRDGVLKPSPERFEMMYNEAQHLHRLVEDLRTLSLADAGELTITPQAVSPSALLKQIVALYEHRAAQQQVALESKSESGLPTLNVDPDRMMQVLGNLVSNALRYTPEGGKIAMAVHQHQGAVILTVQDTGSGIASEDLPKVFDRFYRADRSRQSDGGESGLGLAIAKSIVELHGGRICVESTPGEGTTFIITLPVHNG